MITKKLTPVKDLFKDADLTGRLSPSITDMAIFTYTHSDDDPGAVFVPRVDPYYLFQADALECLILGDVLNRHVYFYGDTGCGKSTLIAQFCARRGREMFRQNFDETIGRGELIGSTIVTISEGKPVTKWRRGSLAASMLRPATFVLDEYDAGTSGATILVNPVLESDACPSVYVPETEEILVPHGDWRAVATGNTDGVNPDERGIYPGTQAQNMATLNRFAYRTKINYLTPSAEASLLRRKYPTFPADVAKVAIKFTEEYRRAWSNTRELTVPFSTRMLHNIIEASAMTESLWTALEYALLSSVPQAEKRVITELAKRVGIAQA